MPACGYEFYLRVQLDTSERSERVRYRVEYSKIKFISTSGHVISSIYLANKCHLRRTMFGAFAEAFL